MDVGVNATNASTRVGCPGRAALPAGSIRTIKQQTRGLGRPLLSGTELITIDAVEDVEVANAHVFAATVWRGVEGLTYCRRGAVSGAPIKLRQAR
jgi:hypothetical protein